MRFEVTKKIGLFSIAALAAAFALPASASPVGTLAVFGCGGGSVTVTSSAIDFSTTSTATPGVPGCVVTGGVTNVSSTFGLLTGNPAVTGTIKDITGPVPPSIPAFMAFPVGAGTLSFTLTGLGPGSANSPCTSINASSGCTILAGSPFTLFMVPGTNNTTVILPAFGTVSDASGTSTWSGQFSADFAGLTPVQLQNQFATTGSLSSTTFSGSFIISAVPEPGTLGSLGIGLAFIGASTLFRKRRTANNLQ